MKALAKRNLLVSTFWLTILLILGLSATHPMPALAASYVVNTLADDTTDDVVCSLREAINAANNAASNDDCGAASTANDTITFDVSGTITLTSTLPDILAAVGQLTIDGTGQTVTISGNHSVRVLVIDPSGWLRLNHVTIADGTGGNGSGVYNSGGTLIITNSSFIGNGNAIGAVGGAVYSLSNGVGIISNSTFSGNYSTGGAGGGGGAVYSYGGIAIANSTFSGNFITSGTQGNAIGIAPAKVITLTNTIVMNNTGGDGNCGGGGTVSNGGHNIDNGTTCGWGSGSGSLSSVNPGLGSLADNGGPTLTFSLLPGSPAIDAGDDAVCATIGGKDQRDIARPIGSHCDIGSYEAPLFLFLPLITR